LPRVLLRRKAVAIFAFLSKVGARAKVTRCAAAVTEQGAAEMWRFDRGDQ
jgi:hypothetical protein